MIIYDLRHQSLTIDELFQIAADEAVQVIAKDGQTFIVESADDFEQEVAMLRQSAKFMAFLADRAKEEGSITLEELEQEIDERIAQEAAHKDE
jgi:hypothetical protein